jgi:hypothetical protein
VHVQNCGDAYLSVDMMDGLAVPDVYIWSNRLRRQLDGVGGWGGVQSRASGGRA